MMTTDNRAGVYVHIPYCVRKCNYCDFCSYPIGAGAVPDEYISALLREASCYSGLLNEEVSTVYIGGGTPSLLSPSQLVTLLTGLGDVFTLSQDCEITLEANPGTVTVDKLRAFRSAGVNRISMGMQSACENELKILGRIYSPEEFECAFSACREAGFDNISVDLMYGLPEQTMESLLESARTACSLSPEHISAYGLMVEEGTPFFVNRDSLALPDEDTEADMYAALCDYLASMGYEHYEISNYARDGRYSRHNLKYWHGTRYIGLGASAYSYFDNKRYGNGRDIAEYLACPTPRLFSENGFETIGRDDEAFEYAMLSLRLKWGIDLKLYRRRFGIDFMEGREDKISFYVKAGLACVEGGRFFLTERGFYISNNLMADIL